MEKDGIELVVIWLIIAIGVLIMASFLGKEPSQEYQMEECMRRYKDFDYCKYRLGGGINENK